MSAPPGKSFNDGISSACLKEWTVFQTTPKQFADMVARAGKGAVISCSDMVNAYKCIPVCKKQQRLQVFHFCGHEFVDLRLVFGDKMACMFYDRFHRCIVTFFVLPLAPMPMLWIGETVDDITTAVPPSAAKQGARFVKVWKEEL